MPAASDGQTYKRESTNCPIWLVVACGAMALLVLYVVLAIGVSFLCSIMEAVLLSVTPGYVAMLEHEGRPAAARLRALKDDIDRPLAAILSLNTIAHTVGAAGAGAQAAKVFGDAVVGIFSGVLTFLILILSEIIPKTLGATYWKTLAAPVARLLGPLIKLLYPLVKLSQWLTVLIANEDRAAVSREEIAALARVGEREGVVAEDESRIVGNLLRLRALQVESVMTPRVVVFTLPASLTVGEALARHEEICFSRVPLTSSGKDAIDSYVLKHDVLLAAAQDRHDLQLEAMARRLSVVSELLPISELLEQLLVHSEQIALVVDEHGSTAGLVTLEDAVETLLGLEIVDETDTTTDLRQLAREQWQRRARRQRLLVAPKGDAEEDSGDVAWDSEEQRRATIRYGNTGGVPPVDDRGA